MSEPLYPSRDGGPPAGSFSPKSSPRGCRSPMAAPSLPRHDSSTGTLKMTISAGKHPAVVNSGPLTPFYLMKDQACEAGLTGSTNLMAHYCLEHSYNKFTGKKVKDSLSSFLPSLPGNLDNPAHLTNSSLKELIEKPPIFKEFGPLNRIQLSGFRLQPGPLPEQYRFQWHGESHRKQKKRGGDDPVTDGGGGGATPLQDSHEKRPHKKKKNDDEKERKKKKKEKKKKKQKHSPEHSNPVVSSNMPESIKLS